MSSHVTCRPFARAGAAAWLAVLATLFGSPSYAQGTISVTNGPEERSSNSLLAMSASRYASASDEVEIRRRGLRLEWDGRVFVTFKNVSLTLLRVVNRPWYYDYSVNIFDSEGKLVLPTAKGEALLDSRAREAAQGVVIGVAVADMLPAQAWTEQLELALVYPINPIKPGESYTVKVRRLHGLPTKDAAGKQITDPELACTLAIEGRTP